MNNFNSQSTIFLGLFSLIVGLNLPTNAETCVPISLVGGSGNEITKEVSQPTIPGPFGIDITRNNWNTDWAIPGGQQFKRFITTVSSEKGGEFDIKMYLKYSDQTTGVFYDTEGVQLNPGQPLIIDATPRPEDQPYQVNLFVGGLNHIGNSYTASVVGCY